MFEKLIELLFTLLYPFAGIGGFVIIIFILWLFSPEKVEKWSLCIYKLCAYVSDKHERKYIGKHIETTVNEKSKRLSKESSGSIPYELKVEWVDVEAIESYLSKNVLIIKMKNHRNQSKNLALAVKEYTPNALIPTARKYVEPSLMKAIDYVISKTILLGDSSALEYFIKMNEPVIDQNIKELVEKIDKVNNSGQLSRIMLYEYKKLGFLYPSDPSNEHYKETLNFARIIYDLLTREPEEKVDVTKSKGKFIKAAVVPVAKASTVEMYGIEPHINYIKTLLSLGIKTIYIVTAGKLNLTLAKEIVMRVEKEFKLQKKYEDEYDGYYHPRNTKLKMYVAILEVPEEI